MNFPTYDNAYGQLVLLNNMVKWYAGAMQK